MKHDYKIIIYLVILFFAAQVIGLFLLNQSIDSVETSENGTIVVEYTEPITGRPELEGQDSFTYIATPNGLFSLGFSKAVSQRKLPCTTLGFERTK